MLVACCPMDDLAQLAPGQVLAKDFRVLRALAAGGMGSVYLVEQLSTGKQRALKTMHRELVYDPASRQRFEQEARIGSRIASEHVVEVQAAGVDQVIFVQQGGRNRHDHICQALELFAAEVMPALKADAAEREARKQAELAPYIAAALARKPRMAPIEESAIPTVSALRSV